MKTKVIIFLVLVIVLIGGLSLWYKNSKAPSSELASSSSYVDHKNAVYYINGADVKLNNGYAETTTTSGSALKIVTRYFGNEATGDLAGKGTEDKAFLVTQSSGGSGTFYYVVAALKTADGYQGMNAILLGDRVAPQTTEIWDKEIAVNYADRQPGQPMTAQPSLGVSRYFRVENGMLVEVKK